MDVGDPAQRELEGYIRTCRVFVDVEPLFCLPDMPGYATSREHANIVRRLLAMDPTTVLPVALFSDQILVLTPEQVTQLLRYPEPLVPEIVPEKVHDASQSCIPESPMVRARLACTRAMRVFVAHLIRTLPAAVREEVRSILIHARKIARIVLYGRGPSISSEVSQPIPPVTRIEYSSLIPLLQLVAYPQPDDVLWTTANEDTSARLRTLSIVRRKTGVRIAVLWGNQRQMSETQPSDLAALVSLLDSADLLVANSVEIGKTLIQIAHQTGRAVPEVHVVGHFAHEPTGDEISDARDNVRSPEDFEALLKHFRSVSVT